MPGISIHSTGIMVDIREMGGMAAMAAVETEEETEAAVGISYDVTPYNVGMENSKRVTVYLEPAVHKALRLKAAASDRSVSDVVNDAVRLSLGEYLADIEVFSTRKKERGLSFESFVTGLKRRGQI
jgi:hypothetical protein